jgi:hypothetical protein
MKTVRLAAGAAMIFANSAWAQEMPRYDPVAQCKRIAGFGGSYSETTYGACFDQEQVAYDALKLRWTSIPIAIQKQCDRIGRFGGTAHTPRFKRALIKS